MVAVPADNPVTIPEGLMLMVDDVEYQVPPLLPFEINNVDEPTHKVDAPLIVPAVATGLTETLNEAEDAPQVLETV